MRERLHIENILRVNEERAVAFQNVHTWLMPIDEVGEGMSIIDSNLLDYMIRYSSWREHKSTVRSFNERMTRAVLNSSMIKKTQSLREILRDHAAAVEKYQPNAAAYSSESPQGAGTLYRRHGIEIAHDGQVGIPGAFTITCRLPRDIDATRSAIIYLRMRFLEYQLRIALRQELGVEYAYKIQEAKIATGADLSPMRILPIVNIEKYDRIYNFTIKNYIEENGSWSTHKREILESGRLLKAWIAKVELLAQDAELESALLTFERLA
jgi:hypothetical protein